MEVQVMEGVLYLPLSAGDLEAVTVDTSADSAPPLPTWFSEVKLWKQLTRWQKNISIG